VVFFAGLLTTILSFSFADVELSTGVFPGGNRSKTKASELAYGSLAFIDENALPASTSTST
jgi:hypothetical protein